MADRNLILLSGVSGAGKSTVAELFIDADIISTDDFFMVNGKYQFDANSLIENHMKCAVKAEQSMHIAHTEDVMHTLIIHNTFTKDWEMQPYLVLADKYGYMVHTLIVENRHGSESVHNVPQASVNAQRDRFEVIL